MMTVIAAPTYEQAKQYAAQAKIPPAEWRYAGEARLLLALSTLHRKGRIIWYEGDMSWHDDPARLRALEMEVDFAILRGWTFEEA